MTGDVNRRTFFGAAAGAGVAIAVAGGITSQAVAAETGAGIPAGRRAIQLYTLREIMTTPNAVRQVLDALGAMGYAEVEMAGHYGQTAAQLRRVLDRAGLRAVSGHDGFDLVNPDWEQYKRDLEYAVTLGQVFTGFPWWGGPYDEAHFRLLAQRLGEAAELARQAGLRFFYHNHNFEFENKDADGRPLFDLLLNGTSRDQVLFELDLYWITRGGANPLAYLSADPGRYPLYHVKDRTWEDRPGEEDWEDAGPGAIDFRDIFDAGDGGGGLDKHYVVEHDNPFLSHPGDAQAPLTTARVGIEFLKTVRW